MLSSLEVTEATEIFNTAFSGYNPHAVQDKRVLEFKPFNHALEVIQKIVPNKYLCIAGGAVRDLFMVNDLLIKDIDVFILDVDDDQEKSEIIKRCSEKLLGNPQRHVPGYPANFNVLWNSIIPPLEAKPYSFPAMSVIKKAIGNTEKRYPVQIVAHTAKTPPELMEDFDWKCCKFAYDGKNTWRCGADDFAAARMRLGTVKNAFYTLRRGFYLQEKFKRAGVKLSVEKEELLTLASMMLLDPEAQ